MRETGGGQMIYKARTLKQNGLTMISNISSSMTRAMVLRKPRRKREGGGTDPALIILEARTVPPTVTVPSRRTMTRDERKTETGRCVHRQSVTSSRSQTRARGQLHVGTYLP